MHQRWSEIRLKIQSGVYVSGSEAQAAFKTVSKSTETEASAKLERPPIARASLYVVVSI